MLEFSMFKRLPLWSQAEVLMKEGTMVAQRQHLEWEITLYQLNNHFVELWSGKGLRVVGSFHQEAPALQVLDPYTDAIDVQHLLIDN
ncbi:hypothetical protein [Pontibacter sp. SGAir0037]|uniref:hypothetical protein n=1 Tax=Pontibacter sp. SGAir0037 TaxID=2571030 RepID=UPI0010CCB4FA|nr:hypothetical protein [Pontibacter sp. SGAir0037]QCR22698.1 hypothetical protein C1N53_10310 [Pontibacter sp. SGAir0037]